LLKPLKGSEENLADNLRSFFEQGYAGPLEFIFAAETLDDPGLDVAREISGDYPHIPTRFVISDPSYGLNPKVANLAAAYHAAEHDLVLQSDANVRVSATYIQDIVSELVATDASLLTSLVIGVGERSVGAAMENLQLGAFVAPAVCTALHVARVTCVIGKSMLFRRSELEALGGLASVRDILCEDFVLGQLYAKADKRVVLSATTVENVNQNIGIRQFLARHSRWLKMRAVIHVPAFVADLFSNPVCLMLLAFIAGGADVVMSYLLAAVVTYKVAGDAFMLRVTRGHGMAWYRVALGPIKDCLMGVVWVYSVFSRSVRWRGRRLRFGKMSRLRDDEGSLAVRFFRLLGRPFQSLH